ncbi:MAG TPA: pyruvate, phosphate dikinase [Smithellaceae bacterium]|jgi:pyruvate,orthophosphate dikinase|nr:pyruvate, phosphate dikinase [Smithellaceae bacterium]HOM69006.1 pyruvate, phosphate dikinase [Smithellaceae bacterium]HOS09026.1 pyruvate, phosphate dikinase [Smithellaceae bacterium]HOU05396.1 pyruvate, phosphate dikinase [Smithellaceae bacterium]HPD49400.1 pyruvate, phosphate dikinase [Smithellaceae bacterium]
MGTKYVYTFSEGYGKSKNLLGGKGVGLAEMAHLKIPIPPGFTITTEVCIAFLKNKGRYPQGLKEQVAKALQKMEKETGMKFGDPKNPLLCSARSGARKSMPGMMETVLNIGLTSKTIPGMIEKTKNPRFVWDSYRRLIQMYSDVVMEKAEDIEPEEGMGVRQQLEKELVAMKQRRNAKSDVDLTEKDLEELADIYRAKVKEVLGKSFPDNANEQLWGAIGAVFKSWNGKRAVAYRRIEGIPDDWGTAVNVQAMVFGNMGENSATGVAFTRNPATGENKFYGEWLPNAQGEDVVAGIRTPNPINEETRHSDDVEGHPSLEKAMPKAYAEIKAIRNRLEAHFRDMQDLEFTIQDGRVWMLQTRTGKRNGPAAVRMAVEMYKSKMISAQEAVMRVTPAQLDEMLHPMVDPKAETSAEFLVKGLPAGPGGAVGQVAFTSDVAVEWKKEGKKVILVREETNPEDVEGMRAAEGVLTARGGMTSHAALVARGWGKCCIVGAGALHVDIAQKVMKADGKTVREGDFITLNGTKGRAYLGSLPMISGAENDVNFAAFMKICDSVRRLKIRTNAETPKDAAKAVQFGAEGIGLFRTEHMFYGENSEQPLFYLRKMIIADNEEQRRAALDELFPFVKDFIKKTIEAMGGRPVTIRLLDPPLHEFVPENPEERQRLANSLGISLDNLNSRAEKLHETNPMMGHRGVRLGITYPEISEMQIRAILEAAAELIKEGEKAFPEIMIPVVCDVAEFKNQAEIVKKVYPEVLAKYNLKKISYMVGTMIEIPRAALLADKIAEEAEFFSFGTNDLTQMTYGFSRDDVGAFVPGYLAQKIIPVDPFQILDQTGVGQLIQMGVERGRRARAGLKVGICGEHGGEPSSVMFCHRVGMDYVSCSPYRVPIARLAAAQAAAEEKSAVKKVAGKSIKKKRK